MIKGEICPATPCTVGTLRKTFSGTKWMPLGIYSEKPLGFPENAPAAIKKPLAPIQKNLLGL